MLKKVKMQFSGQNYEIVLFEKDSFKCICRITDTTASSYILDEYLAVYALCQKITFVCIFKLY